MVALARDQGGSGAMFEVSGYVATNATWSEDIYFTDEGSAMDISELDWKMTFRCAAENTTADFTLSLSDYLSIEEDDDSGVERVLRIAVPAGQLSSYRGDYICDLASEDSQGVVALWAHGIISFRLNPVTF